MVFRNQLWIIAGFALGAFICVRIIPLNDLWKSQEGLKASILKQAPLGSSVDQVKGLIKNRNWRLMAEWHGTPSNVSSAVPYPAAKDYPGVKGEYFIHADLGSYQGIPFRVGVDALLGFDAAGHLVDLRIRKGVEGP